MFVHDENFALLITWTCYGTWLPGDCRGYVSNTRRPDSSYERTHNIPGTQFTANDPVTRQYSAEKQQHTTATLDQEHAPVAARGILDACANRNWHVVRAALMWNHVHVIVVQCPDNGPKSAASSRASAKTLFANMTANRSAGGPKKEVTDIY